MTDHGARYQPGQDTRDIRNTITTADPTGDHAQEHRTQRVGNRLLAAGFTTLALTLMLSLGVSMAYNDTPFPNPDAKIFGNLAFVTLMVTGGCLLTAGLTERIQRGSRARRIAGAAATYERGEQLHLLLRQHILDMQERLDLLTAYVTPLPGRLAAAEESLRALIEVLPEEMKRQYWVGFNTAIREGYAETGTDGTGNHRPHLGLVPPTDPDAT